MHIKKSSVIVPVSPMCVSSPFLSVRMVSGCVGHRSHAHFLPVSAACPAHLEKGALKRSRSRALLP